MMRWVPLPSQQPWVPRYATGQKKAALGLNRFAAVCAVCQVSMQQYRKAHAALQASTSVLFPRRNAYMVLK